MSLVFSNIDELDSAFNLKIDSSDDGIFHFFIFARRQKRCSLLRQFRPFSEHPQIDIPSVVRQLLLKYRVDNNIWKRKENGYGNVYVLLSQANYSYKK